MKYNRELSPMPYTIRDIQELQAEGIGVMNELNIFVKSHFYENNVNRMAVQEFQEMMDAMFEAYDQMYDLLFWNLPEEELEKYYTRRVIN